MYLTRKQTIISNAIKIIAPLSNFFIVVFLLLVAFEADNPAISNILSIFDWILGIPLFGIRLNTAQSATVYLILLLLVNLVTRYIIYRASSSVADLFMFTLNLSNIIIVGGTILGAFLWFLYPSNPRLEPLTLLLSLYSAVLIYLKEKLTPSSKAIA